MTDTTHQPDPTSAQPLLSVGTITAVGSALIAALVAFGLKISDDQQSAVLAVIGVLAPIVVALWGRRKVYAPATVARLLAARRPARTELRGEHGPELLNLDKGTTVTYTDGQLPAELSEQLRDRIQRGGGTPRLG